MGSRLKQIPESLLAKLWKEKASRERFFRAGDGRRLRVIYPGRFGTTAGPDFRDAVFLEEGVGLVRGDVEIHVTQKDWVAHGHGDDPRYNGVVLHAVAEKDNDTTTLHSGRQVPVLSLDPIIHRSTVTSDEPGPWALLKAHGYHQPGSAFEMGELLDEAGDARFSGKCDTFRRFLDEETPEQVLYSAMMEALGYSQNREPFLELSDRVPYRRLAKAVVAIGDGERLSVIQSLLLSAAGFLRSGAHTTAGDYRPLGKALTATSRRVGASMSLNRWHLFRVRPQNHPVQRIRAFAFLIDRFLPSSAESPSTRPPWARKGLVEGLSRLTLAPSGPGTKQKRWKPLEHELVVTEVAGKWTGDVANDGKEVSLIGRDRSRDMAVNSVLPLLHALAQLTGDGGLALAALEVYREFPKLQENEITREMGRQLLDPLQGKSGSAETAEGPPEKGRSWARLIQNARRQQGLLHLHHLLASPGIPSRGDSAEHG